MRISQPTLPQINRELARLEEFHKRISALEAKFEEARIDVNQLQDTHLNGNNLTFTWTGGTTTISWNAGAVKNFHPRTFDRVKSPIAAIPAGSLTASASTFYWMIWNKLQGQMIASNTVDGFIQNTDNILLCQIFTGTGAQSGTAGGGGSSGSYDLNGARYKLF